jgi:hypothetical protein
MTQQNNRTRKLVVALATAGFSLGLMNIANSSTGTLVSDRQVEINERLREAKPIAGRNRRRLNTAIRVSGYPKANADKVRVSRQSNKLRINVLSNDQGYKLKVIDINRRSASGARVSLKNDMAVYQIPRDFSGEDSFWYTLEDKSGRQHSAKVIVCICDK